MDVNDVILGCFDTIKEQYSNLKTLNILIMGKTGVGKSTLINSVFDENLATTGMGQPVTQSMSMYSKPGVPLRIYDTKGLELGEVAQREVKAEIFDKINELNRKKDIGEAIHCIWYCINATSDRIEEEELEWLKTFTKENQTTEIPVIVVLTKAYLKKQSREFASYIREQNLNVAQIIPVLALDTEIDEDVFVKSYGLEELVEIMGNVLPDEIIKTFVSVQCASVREKEKYAMTIVTTAATAAAAQGAIPIPFADAALLVPTQVGMLAGISIAFGMDFDDGLLNTFVSSVFGCTGATLVGKGIANLLKAIPGVGSVVGGAISGGTAFALTSALGKAYVKLMVMLAEGEITSAELQGEKGSQILTDLYKECQAE